MTSSSSDSLPSCQRSDAFMPILVNKIYEGLKAAHNGGVYITYKRLHEVTPIYIEMLVRKMGVNPHLSLPAVKIYPCVKRAVKELVLLDLLQESEYNPGTFYFQEESNGFYDRLMEWLDKHKKQLGASELEAAEKAGQAISYAYIHQIKTLGEVLEAIGAALPLRHLTTNHISSRPLART